MRAEAVGKRRLYGAPTSAANRHDAVRHTGIRSTAAEAQTISYGYCHANIQAEAIVSGAVQFSWQAEAEEMAASGSQAVRFLGGWRVHGFADEG